MIKGSSVRKAEHPIDPLFIDRWSPRALAGEPLDIAQLLTLFEAARWAPSSGNFQPWRFLYAHRDGAHWHTFLDLLTPGNQSWAGRAAALVLFISRHSHDDGSPVATHAYDTGAAWQNFALQGHLSGLVVHGMQGFDYAKARRVLGVPASYSVEAMAAVGKPGDKALLTEQQQQRENPNGRRSVADSAHEGLFDF
jgi:nitroreductase